MAWVARGLLGQGLILRSCMERSDERGTTHGDGRSRWWLGSVHVYCGLWHYVLFVACVAWLYGFKTAERQRGALPMATGETLAAAGAAG